MTILEKEQSDDIISSIEKGLDFPWQGVRPEIKLHQGTPEDDGTRTWVIEDPVQGNYFEIGDMEAALLISLFTSKDIKSALIKLLQTTNLKPSASDVFIFLKMLQHEKLAIISIDVQNQIEDKASAQKDPKDPENIHWFKKIISGGYLFIRIPLIRPDNFLNAALPWLSPLWSKSFFFIYAILGCIGLLFVIQDWELYIHTANHLFTPEGAFYFLLSLCLVKTLHEFGHGFAAKAHGIFVRRMGLAFMVFMPILYCDVSDAWRLSSTRGRLMIALGGVIVELTIAGIALFLWSVLPAGIMKGIMFYVSSASIVSSIMTNMNPLMQFDAYYVVMDYLSISNLRTRAKALSLHVIRRILVDWQGPIPEVHPRHRFLVIFGFFCILYRIFIFLIISFAVYHYVFKALGVVLVVLQISRIFFVPIFKEIRFLFSNLKYWGDRRILIRTLAVSLCILIMICAPLPSFQKLPGFFLEKNTAKIVSSEYGIIDSVFPKIGSYIAEKDLLVKIKNPYLEHEYEILMYDLARIQEGIKKLDTGGVEGGYRYWLIKEQERIIAEIKTVRQKILNLTIRSPLSGYVSEINESLRKGSYISKKSFLLSVGNSEKHEVRGYANEDIYKKLKSQSDIKAGVVFKNMEYPSLNLLLNKAFDFPASVFPNDALFDIAKGPISSMPSSSDALVPKTAHYTLIFDVPKIENIEKIKHGYPCDVYIKTWRSRIMTFFNWVFKGIAGEGLI
jgi:putative peptide zinc metalloprotease protein